MAPDPHEAPDAPDDPGKNYEDHPAFADLDDGVQAAVTPKGFAWMPDVERTRFLRSIGEPDTFADS